MYINRVLVRRGLDEIVLATHLFRPLRFTLYLQPWHWFRRNKDPAGVRLRLTLEDLGPIFVKFGQILSTRKDLLPDEIAGELARLQDKVPPFPGEQAVAIIEKSFGKPISELFASFDVQPFASASIAQVHAARLPDGTEVIVKVVRPGIHKVIRRDISLMQTIAEWAERYSAVARRLHVCDVVHDFEQTLYDELDMQREASSASQLRRNFAGSKLLYVPEVYWAYTRKRVMVMERISGIPIGDIDALRNAGIDLRALAEDGVEVFFTQVFCHNFFHADMHPGNIFVGADGRYIAIDFGIMGSLRDVDQRYLAENFHAFFRRDYRRVAELHVASNWVPKDTRVDEFEAAIRSVCEPIFERPLSEISFGHLLVNLFQTARRFNMEVQPQLVLLQKTLLNIEGLGRQLYPELDLWVTAKPFLEQWMLDRVGPKAFVKAVLRNGPYWVEKLPELPGLIHEFLQEGGNVEGRDNKRRQEMDQLRKEMRRANRLSFRAITGSAFIVSAVIILVMHSGQFATVGNVPVLSLLLGGLGAFILIFSWPEA